MKRIIASFTTFVFVFTQTPISLTVAHAGIFDMVAQQVQQQAAQQGQSPQDVQDNQDNAQDHVDTLNDIIDFNNEDEDPGDDLILNTVTFYASGNVHTYTNSSGTFFEYYDEAFTTGEFDGNTENVGRVKVKIFTSGTEFRYLSYHGNTDVYEFRERWSSGVLQYTRENYASGAQRALEYPSGSIYTYYEGTPENRGNRESLFASSTGYTYYYIDEDFDGNGVGRRSRTIAPSGNEYTYLYHGNTDNVQERKKFIPDGNGGVTLSWTRTYYEVSGNWESTLYESTGNFYTYIDENFFGGATPYSSTRGRKATKTYPSGTQLVFTEYWPGTNVVKTRDRFVLDNGNLVLSYTRTYYASGRRESDTFAASGNQYFYFDEAVVADVDTTNSSNAFIGRRSISIFASSGNEYHHTNEDSSSYQHLNPDFSSNSHGRYTRRVRPDGTYTTYDEYWVIGGQQTDMVKQSSEYDAAGNLISVNFFDENGDPVDPTGVSGFVTLVTTSQFEQSIKDILMNTFGLSNNTFESTTDLTPADIQIINDTFLFLPNGDPNPNPVGGLDAMADFLSKATAADLTALNDIFSINLQDGITQAEFDNTIPLLFNSQGAKDVDTFIQILQGLVSFQQSVLNDPLTVGIQAILNSAFDIPNINSLAVPNNTQTIIDSFLFLPNGDPNPNPTAGLEALADLLDQATAQELQQIDDLFGTDVADGVASRADYDEIVPRLFNAQGQKDIQAFLDSLVGGVTGFVNLVLNSPLTAGIQAILASAFSISDINNLSPADIQTINDTFLFLPNGDPNPNPTAGLDAVADLINQATAGDLNVLNDIYGVNLADGVTQAEFDLTVPLLFNTQGAKDVTGFLSFLQGVSNFQTLVLASSFSQSIQDILDSAFGIADINNLNANDAQTINDTFLFLENGDPNPNPIAGLDAVADLLDQATASDLVAIDDLFGVNLADGVTQAEFDTIVPLLFNQAGQKDIQTFLETLVGGVTGFVNLVLAHPLTNSIQTILASAFGINDVNNLSAVDIGTINNTFLFLPNGQPNPNPIAGLDAVADLLDQASAADLAAINDVFGINLADGVTLAEFDAIVPLLFNSLGQKNISGVIETAQGVVAFQAAVLASPLSAGIQALLADPFGIADINNLTAANVETLANTFLFLENGDPNPNPIAGLDAVADLLDQASAADLAAINDVFGINLADGVTLAEFDAIVPLLFNSLGQKNISGVIETAQGVVAFQAAVLASPLSAGIQALLADPFGIADINNLTAANVETLANTFLFLENGDPNPNPIAGLDAVADLLDQASAADLAAINDVFGINLADGVTLAEFDAIVPLLFNSLGQKNISGVIETAQGVVAFQAAVLASPLSAGIQALLADPFGIADINNLTAANVETLANTFLFLENGDPNPNPIAGLDAVADLLDQASAADLAAINDVFGINLADGVTLAEFDAIVPLLFNSLGQKNISGVIETAQGVVAFQAAVLASPLSAGIQALLADPFGIADINNLTAANVETLANTFLFLENGDPNPNPIAGLDAVADLLDQASAADLAAINDVFGINLADGVTLAEFDAIVPLLFNSLGQKNISGVIETAQGVVAFQAAVLASPLSAGIQALLADPFGIADINNLTAANVETLANTFLFLENGDPNPNPIAGLDAVADLLDQASAADLAAINDVFGINLADGVTLAEFDAIVPLLFNSLGQKNISGVIETAQGVVAFQAAVLASPLSAGIQALLADPFGIADINNLTAANVETLANTFLFLENGDPNPNPIAGLDAVADLLDQASAADLAAINDVFGINLADGVTLAEFDAIVPLLFNSLGQKNISGVIETAQGVVAFQAAVLASPLSAGIQALLADPFGIADINNLTAANVETLANTFLFLENGDPNPNPIAGLDAVADLLDQASAADLAAINDVFGINLADGVTLAEFDAIVPLLFNSLGQKNISGVIETAQGVVAFQAAVLASPLSAGIQALLADPFGIADINNLTAANVETLANTFLFLENGDPNPNPIAGLDAVADLLDQASAADLAAINDVFGINLADGVTLAEFDAIVPLLFNSLGQKNISGVIETAQGVVAFQAAVLASPLSAGIQALLADPFGIADINNLTAANVETLANTFLFLENGDPNPNPIAGLDAVADLLDQASAADLAAINDVFGINLADGVTLAEFDAIVPLLFNSLGQKNISGVIETAQGVVAFQAAVLASPLSAGIQALLADPFGIADINNLTAANVETLANTFLFLENGDPNPNPIAGLDAVADLLDQASAADLAAINDVFGINLADGVTLAEFDAIVPLLFNSLGQKNISGVIETAQGVVAFQAAVLASPLSAGIQALLADPFGIADINNLTAANVETLANTFLFQPSGEPALNPILGLEVVADFLGQITFNQQLALDNVFDINVIDGITIDEFDALVPKLFTNPTVGPTIDIQIVGPNVEITIQNDINAVSYIVEGSNDLSNWTVIEEINPSAGATTVYAVPLGTFNFFRVGVNAVKVDIPNFLAVLEDASNLLNALKGNIVQRNAFNNIFGTNIQIGVPLTDFDIQKLFDVTGDPNHDLGEFLIVLPKASDLHDDIQSSQTNREAFETVFGIALADQVITNADYVAKVFDIAGGQTFNNITFPGLMVAAAELHAELDTRRANFATVYQISVADQNFDNPDYIDQIFSIVAGQFYDIATFPAILDGVVSLDARLEAEGLRTEFRDYSVVFFSEVPEADQNFSNDDYLVILFSRVGDPNFDEDAFISWLDFNF